MNSASKRMRPMGIADILDETVELYKSSFVLLVGIAAVMYVPYAIVTQYATMQMLRVSSIPNIPSTTELYTVLGVIVLSYLYLIVTAPFVTGAMTYAISEVYLGRKVTIISCFRRVFSLSIFGQLMAAIMVKAFALLVPIFALLAVMQPAFILGGDVTSRFWVILLAMILVLPAAVLFALFMLLKLALTESVVVLEMKGIGYALARSWKLMPGNMLKYFGLLLVSAIVVSLVSYVTTAPTQTIIATGLLKGASVSGAIVFLHTAINALVGTILAPVMSIVTILLYYDIRIRREGFDLELLASELQAGIDQGFGSAVRNLPQEPSSSDLPANPAPPKQGPDE